MDLYLLAFFLNVASVVFASLDIIGRKLEMKTFDKTYRLTIEVKSVEYIVKFGIFLIVSKSHNL